jgi:hypothetical protein
MHPPLHLMLYFMLCLVASTASTTLVKTTRRDPKGRYLAATMPNESSELTSSASSFIFPSIPNIATSPPHIISYTPPPVPPSTPLLSTTQVPHNDDENVMLENVNPFWGDNEHLEESPQDFLKAMQCWGLNKTNGTDTQKLENFRLNLKSNATAEQWFENLLTKDRDTWDHLVRAFNKQWPNKVATIKTVEEKQMALEQTRISKEEVGKRIMMNGMEELLHIVWADKIEWLAAAIPDTNGLLISAICRSMPKVLFKVTGSGHMNWAMFCMAIHMATLTQIIGAKQEEEEAHDLKEQVRKLQELCEMSAQDITNALQWLTMSTPSPLPISQHSRCNQPMPQTISPLHAPHTKCQTNWHTDRTEALLST